MNRALSFVMMRNGTRASYGRKLDNSYFSSFKRVKKIKLHLFFSRMINNYCSQYKTFSMPPGGCETEKILWYHREMVLDSRKSGFTNLSTSGFLRKMGKWPKNIDWKKKRLKKTDLRHGHYGSDFGPFKMSDSCIYSYFNPIHYPHPTTMSDQPQTPTEIDRQRFDRKKP